MHDCYQDNLYPFLKVPKHPPVPKQRKKETENWVAAFPHSGNSTKKNVYVAVEKKGVKGRNKTTEAALHYFAQIRRPKWEADGISQLLFRPWTLKKRKKKKRKQKKGGT